MTATLTKTPARFSITRALKVAYEMNAEYTNPAATISAIQAALTKAEEGVTTQARVSGEQAATTRAQLAQTTPATHTPTVAILTALDAAMSTIRETHPDVPSALAIVIATGNGKKHGHFHAQTWEDAEHAGKRHEILMASESLARGAELTLTTLIHEAAHALNYATGNKDTSRQGRYHNQTFSKTAANMGLLVESDEKSGFRTTGLNSWAKAHYADTLTALEGVLTTYRVPVDKKASKPKTTIRVTCECEYPVTVPIKWWDDYGMDNMLCGMCETHFTPES